MEKLYGMCGILCSSCEAYEATQKNDLSALEILAEKFSKEFGGTMTIDQVKCDGCMGNGPNRVGYCAMCKTRLCGVEKLFHTCKECESFPCEDLQKGPHNLANLQSL